MKKIQTLIIVTEIEVDTENVETLDENATKRI